MNRPSYIMILFGHLGLFLIALCFYFLLFPDRVYSILVLINFIIGSGLLVSTKYFQYITKNNKTKYIGSGKFIDALFGVLSFGACAVAFGIALSNNFYNYDTYYMNLVFWSGLVFLAFGFLISLFSRFLEVRGQSYF